MTTDEARVIVFLRRRAGLSRAGFSAHWGERHGPLVAAQPAFWRHTARYVQNHLTDPGPEPFDGIAVSTRRAGAAGGAGFPAEPCYRTVIRPDEALFLDPAPLVRLHATAHVARDGPRGGSKLMALLDHDRLAIIDALDALGGAAVARVVVNLVDDPPAEGFAARLAAIVEVWTDDAGEARHALGTVGAVFAVTERPIARPATV